MPTRRDQDAVLRLPHVDLSERQARRRAAQHITNMFSAAPEDVHESGMNWYEQAHEDTARAVRGTSSTPREGAGILAAVSPSMDWTKNAQAIKVVHGLREADYHAIAQGDRSSYAGTPIAQASANAMGKVHQILQGHDFEEALPRRTNPKTNAFANNIHTPDVETHVTIDGRAHDIAANRLQGWKENRGIGSARVDTSRGKPTRYEDFETTYRTATDALIRQGHTGLLPHQVQAVTWEMGKRVETAGVTKAGTPRKQGPTRAGQPYFGRSGLLPTPQPRGR